MEWAGERHGKKLKRQREEQGMNKGKRE